MTSDQTPHDDLEDEFIAQSLAAMSKNTPEFRADLAGSVAQSAGDVFEAHAADARNSQSVSPTIRSTDHKTTEQNPTPTSGRLIMIAKIALALSIVVGLFTVFTNPSTQAKDSLTFGEVLDRTLEVDTLQLKVRTADTAHLDVWVNQSGAIRLEESPTRYRIAKGSRLWEVDEEANVVESRAAETYFDGNQHVDFLAVLGVGGSDHSSNIRTTKATGIVEHAGEPCYVYAFHDTPKASVFFNAYVSVETGLLRTIAAWGVPARDGVPFAEVTLVQRDVPIDESKFVVSESLSEDGRIGKIVDAQGIVTLRPITASRWTPVSRQMIVKPGDWIRTDVRGANATSLVFTSLHKAIVGPGTLIECQSPHRIKIHGGEIKIFGNKQSEKPFTLLGPNDQEITVAKNNAAHYMLDRDQTFQIVKTKPVWLAGFEGTTAEDSIGTLVAKVDGRNVPLSVGYHKVNIEIRDQIARTTIEESFVNNTDSTLEGVFYFPLPQDASISGFGMWINGELIEADVVEKQRAREIYETILREKRDPGLLEWTGGNIFKARVFPIFAHSEKRIRIVYTQVLPLRANQYRYSYGLRSEMLQKTPCRELAVNVQIHSEIPLKSVKCSTHPTRNQITKNAARLEFSAQEYTPTRDFEVVCEVDSTQSDVVVIPHRRGDDGYFLVQLTPPGADGNWQRELLPEGQPLDLLVVCDTSASMDSEKRRQQKRFLASLLSSLGPNDRYNLATCDVECEWMFEDSVTQTENMHRETLERLAERRSLGWTDLDVMTKSVLQKLKDDTHVIYVGDGIVTANDADPQAFVNRLKRMTDEKRLGTFHAVSVGNSYESTVLKAVSRIGGGSVRRIEGEQSPQVVAFELLNEIAQPGVRDLKVEFRGLKVAAVYPDQLPNLAAGKQQVLIGRYLPQGEDQKGEIVISGMRDGQPVKFVSRISMKDAESGNSFIPRLWARSHLDHLLEQGSNQFIRDEIIAMSEEFHIITPYTSLLVLETDADRERFNVKRRFQMRDGERFFADGRDDANYQLLQQQMKNAGNWRLGLRMKVLSQYAKLGRNPKLFRIVVPRREDQIYFGGGVGGGGGYGGGFGGGGRYSGLGGIDVNGALYDIHAGHHYTIEHDLFSMSNGIVTSSAPKLRQLHALDSLVTVVNKTELEESYPYKSPIGKTEFASQLSRLPELSKSADRLPLSLEDGEFRRKSKREIAGEYWNQLDWNDNGIRDALGDSDGDSMSYFFANDNAPLVTAGFAFENSRWRNSSQDEWFETISERGNRINHRFRSADGISQYLGSTDWVQRLFPAVPQRTQPAKPVETVWKGEALEISRALQQPLTIEAGGIEVIQQTTSTDSIWNRTTNIAKHVELYSPNKWLSFNVQAGNQTLVNWCDEATRGVYSRSYHTGRTRKSRAHELTEYRPGSRPYAARGLHQLYPTYTATVDRNAQQNNGDKNIVRLTLTNPLNEHSKFAISIDTDRNVMLEFQTRMDGKPTGTTKYSDHQQLAGVWWPRVVTSLNAEGQVVSEAKYTLKSLDEQAFENRFQAEMPDAKTSVILAAKLPNVRDAELAMTDGTAETSHRLILMLRATHIQQWDDALSHLEELEKLHPQKTVIKWLRTFLLALSRNNEQALASFHQRADEILKDGHPDELFITKDILKLVEQLVDRNELLRTLKRVKPVFLRQAEHVRAKQQWLTRYAENLRWLNRYDEAAKISKQVATDAPWDISAQTTYSYDLRRIGEKDASDAWLRQEIDRKPDRRPYEIENLRTPYANNLKNDGRYEDYAAFMKEWIETEPEGSHVYVRYLCSELFAGHVKQADSLARKWLKISAGDKKLNDVSLAKLSAAISYSVGERNDFYMNYLDPQWYKPLQETARRYLDHEHHHTIAQRIVNHSRFANSKESDQLRIEILQLLKSNAERLASDRLDDFVRWSLNNQLVENKKLTNADWEAIGQTLRTRWNAIQQIDEAIDSRAINEKSQIGGALLQIYTNQWKETRQLPFMRDRITFYEKSGKADLVDSHRLALFNELLTRKWTSEIEQEAYQLIQQLSLAHRPVRRLVHRLDALHRFVDRMLEARVQAANETLQDEGHPEELTRTQLAAKRNEFQKSAREGVSDFLQQQLFIDRLAKNADQNMHAEFQAWAKLEVIAIDLKLDRRKKQAAKTCWTMLGDAPEQPAPNNAADDIKPQPTNNDDEEVSPLDLQRLADESILRQLQAARKARALATVRYLAAQKSASKNLVERLLDFIDVGVGFEGEAATPWKQAKFKLLIARDQPEELERLLREWIRDDKAPAPWQLALGRLVAEQGNLDEAIRFYETVEKTSQLKPQDYAALANWYLVKDRRDDYVRAKIDLYKMAPEYQLSEVIRRARRRWDNDNMPLGSELDEEVLFAIQALFEKSNNPGAYMYELRELYTATRDFRLLNMVPDAVVGRTPQQIYEFLGQLQSYLLEEIRKEATADELLKRLGVVRSESKSTTDLRALDLLEALIERRSANVLNQPGPHIDAAVAALKRAFNREWAAGEVRQMSYFLKNLGTISQKTLNAERLRQLRALHDVTEPATDDRLYVDWNLGHALYWSHNEKAEGLAVFESAVDEYDAAHPDGWPQKSNDPLDNYINMLEDAKRFAVAEALLARHIESPLNDSQKYWMLQQQNEVLQSAFYHDGRVSLGEGEELYLNLEKRLKQQAQSFEEESQRNTSFEALLQLYRTANEKKIARAQQDLRKFAFEFLPELLPMQRSYYRNIINSTANRLNDILGPLVALEFAIERLENYPLQYRYNWQNGWSQLGYRIAGWHRDLKRKTGALEPRLLVLVLNELRHDLRTRQNHGRYLYSTNYSSDRFWKEKAGEFLKVAEEVLEERGPDGRTTEYVASYLFHGLDQRTRAIEVLLIADEQNLLNESQQYTLVGYLHRENRYAESIPLLQPMVKRHPNNIRYRTKLIISYHRAKRPQQVTTLVAETDKHFREDGRWTDANVAALASACLEAGLHTEAAEYYTDAIKARERSTANRGVGDGTLSGYYSSQSRAYSKLGQTNKAVDAAAAAIVAWGPRKEQRDNAIHYLRDALSSAKNLDAYVKQRDQQAEKTGQYSPLIRKYIGQVYASKGKHQNAVEQYQLAIDLQPNDTELHAWLVKSYDALGDKDAAISQLLTRLDFERHNLDLYKELARRVGKDDSVEERVVTTIVEAAPKEAEHHQALAEIRQSQNRWTDAIRHWKHVAELRSLEPNGLLQLANAQIHEKRFDKARETVDKLNITEWPPRFKSVKSQIQELQNRIPKEE